MSWAHWIEFGIPALIILLIVVISRWIGKASGAPEEDVDTEPGSGVMGVGTTILKETFKSPRSVTKIRKR